MKHFFIILITLCSIVLLGLIGTFFFVFWPGLRPVLLPTVSAPPLVTNPDIPSQAPDGYYTVGGLTIPNGYTLTLLTDQVPNARDMIIGPDGTIIVSQMKEGRISRVDRSTGAVTTIIDGLNNPHGLLLDIADANLLYIAEEDVLSTIRLDGDDTMYTELISIPEGGRHVSRSLVYNADGDMLMSVGSTCDTCEEENPVHGSIQRVNFETNTLEPYATGLRNAVFMTLHELDGSLWVTEMGRDMLGDDLPPDEINRIEEGNWYGWPWYYGNNIFDEDFADGRMPSFAIEASPATIDLPAHVAPLGIDTIPEEGWPETYWYDLVVAYHGSWNRTPPAGYEVVRHRLSSTMEYLGSEPLITGWLTEENRSFGRPVDVLTVPGGTMYISDDKGGSIYVLQYTGADTLEEPKAATTTLPYITELQSTSTLLVSTTLLTGEALGTWYFEASFPVDVLDSSNTVVDTLIASAQSDWMTTSSVPFTIPFDASSYSGQTISLLLKKDNPSGEPQFDDSIIITNIVIQ